MKATGASSPCGFRAQTGRNGNRASSLWYVPNPSVWNTPGEGLSASASSVPSTSSAFSRSLADKVRVWGPLGNGFAMEPDTPTLLLAGGMGIAPFIGYVAEHPRAWNLTMLFGHTAPIDCYPVDSINERIPIDTLRETVPGDLDNLIFSLEERIKEYASQNGLILACGPTPFLRTIQKFASQYHARCQLSLENKMACGVGGCLGCVVRTTEAWPDPAKRGAPVQCCTQGPVFWSDQVIF